MNCWEASLRVTQGSSVAPCPEVAGDKHILCLEMSPCLASPLSDPLASGLSFQNASLYGVPLSLTLHNVSGIRCAALLEGHIFREDSACLSTLLPVWLSLSSCCLSTLAPMLTASPVSFSKCPSAPDNAWLTRIRINTDRVEERMDGWNEWTKERPWPSSEASLP